MAPKGRESVYRLQPPINSNVWQSSAANAKRGATDALLTSACIATGLMSLKCRPSMICRRNASQVLSKPGGFRASTD